MNPLITNHLKSQEIIYLMTDDNHKVAVHKICPSSSIHLACFLTHGTFSDKRICLGLANFLANHGFTCYILEWRNHGDSDKTTHPFDFETIAKEDIKAVFDYLCHQLNIKHIHAITHSGGGISLSIFLARNPQYISYIKSMTLVACQAFGAANHHLGYVRLLVFKYLTKLVGFIPAKPLKLGITNETYHTMKLWFDWNLNQRFDSQIDGLNYKSALTHIQIPVYAICARHDTVIAPVAGCYEFFRLFSHPDNQFHEFAIKHGNLENYSHSRIMLSQNASKEVWTKILAWINRHA